MQGLGLIKVAVWAGPSRSKFLLKNSNKNSKNLDANDRNHDGKDKAIAEKEFKYGSATNTDNEKRRELWTRNSVSSCFPVTALAEISDVCLQKRAHHLTSALQD